MVKARLVWLVVMAAAFAVICVMLGFWQLDRLEERRTWNTAALEKLGREPIDFDSIRDPAEALLARVKLRGRYDVSREIILVHRTRNGAPGVNIVTPLLREGTDSLVLVNRGWVYSPDGSSLEAPSWRVGIPGSDSGAGLTDDVEVEGMVVAFAEADSRTPAGGATGAQAPPPRVMRLTREAGEALLSAPVAGVYVQLVASDSAVTPGVPVPLPLPVLGSGPHLSYAMQWFAFALIALVGTGLVVAESRKAAGRGRTASASGNPPL